uniref:Uncharacterized protein n=1 Tax=Glossina palpalis gambiensis TaxID=67801 RepID=A0A1B0BJF0_9MUSC
MENSFLYRSVSLLLACDPTGNVIRRYVQLRKKRFYRCVRITRSGRTWLPASTNATSTTDSTNSYDLTASAGLGNKSYDFISRRTVKFYHGVRNLRMVSYLPATTGLGLSLNTSMCTDSVT